MREPYATLLDQYRNHWALWPFLEGDTPDFAGITSSGASVTLSSGEVVMLNVALAFWNGDRTATIADLAALDAENRRRVAEAIYLTMDAVR